MGSRSLLEALVRGERSVSLTAGKRREELSEKNRGQ